MKRLEIFHQTNYYYAGPVQLLSHTLRLRPREGHELRIESFNLEINPVARLRWHRDVEGNSVAVASFQQSARHLSITGRTVVQQYDHAPYDFLLAEHAVNYPFQYADEDLVLLAPYLRPGWPHGFSVLLDDWLHTLWTPGTLIQSFALLLNLNQRIYQTLAYRVREEEGVQTPAQTLQLGSGSCRDFAALFLEAVRRLGFAARFVSGYIYSHAPLAQSGATHAWAEVFLPGAGWKGFDQTTGDIASADHIAVAVARLPESVPPISGAFHGLPGSSMVVDVRLRELDAG